MSRTLTVFNGSQVIASGPDESIKSVLRALGNTPVLVFDDATGEQVDLDLREQGPGEVAPEGERRGPGRPKLGVVGREVTLLPRHWEWLSAQPGGASVALRKLVEHASRASADADRVRRSQDAAFRFISVAAGNAPGYEDACRSLYAGNREGFEARLAAWPADVASYARKLAADAFADQA